jgi:hypothetical protein
MSKNKNEKFLPASDVDMELMEEFKGYKTLD